MCKPGHFPPPTQPGSGARVEQTFTARTVCLPQNTRRAQQHVEYSLHYGWHALLAHAMHMYALGILSIVYQLHAHM